MTEQCKFPPSFAWGVASHAPGGEGLSEASDWRIWERSGKAAPSNAGNGKRDRFEEDLQIISEIGFKHYRMTIEWSRIEPQRGVYNREALDECRYRLEAARRRGLQVMLGLHHFALPAWFSRLGGFMDEAAIQYWHRYVEMVAKEFGKLADLWVPIDQPNYYALASQLAGKIPPGKNRLDKFNLMLSAIFRAHGDAYWILKKYLPAKAHVGMNLFVAPVQPVDPQREADRTAAEFVNDYFNLVPLRLLKEGAANIPGRGGVETPSAKNAADFIAIDYFLRILVQRDSTAGEPGCLTPVTSIEGMPGIRAQAPHDFISGHGYGAYPHGIYDAVKLIHHHGVEIPLYVTASGIATTDEKARTAYAAACLQAVHRAIEQGIDLRGYFHYADVDQYEFDRDFQPQYGLCAFDPDSHARTQRPIADFFNQVINESALDPQFIQPPFDQDPHEQG